MIFRRRIYIGLGCFFVLIAIYGLLGFFQGIMLFTGERALKNANIWGSVFLVAFIGSVLLFLAARGSTTHSTRWFVSRQILSAIALLTALWFVFPIFSDLMAIDSCLDKGGSFDHIHSVCDFGQSHPSMSLFGRQGFRIVAAVVLALPAFLALTKWLQGRKTTAGNAV
jgi:hypothetical protein